MRVKSVGVITLLLAQCVVSPAASLAARSASTTVWLSQTPVAVRVGQAFRVSYAVAPHEPLPSPDASSSSEASSSPDASASVESSVPTVLGLFVEYARSSPPATPRGWRTLATRAVPAGMSSSLAASVRISQRGHWVVRARVVRLDGSSVTSLARRITVVGRRVVALTFDDGPSNVTMRLLPILQRHDARATFFLSGRVRLHTVRARAIVAQGHCVGSHGLTHAALGSLNADALSREIVGGRRAIEDVLHLRPFWFRPPLGSTNPRVRSAIARAGMRQAMWSVDALDWKIRSADFVAARVISSARDGTVFLIHDSGVQRGLTDRAVSTILRTLRTRGYDFVTLDELVALGYRVP